MESYEEADNLASTIRIGGLKLELEELSSKVVGAQLGEEAISTSLMAGAIGLAIVFIFMCIVYLLPGLASSIALVIYTGIVIVLLNAFNITLTLPGIAGIVLSIGMAVDANVIIFARVKEEMAGGKSVKSSLKSGFQKAMSAIVDGNMTTLIAAIVLWVKGTGSVKGFAQTLALGIVVSMFTALVVTRIIIYSFYAVGLRSPKLYGTQKPRKERDFLKRRVLSFSISLVIIVAGFIMMGVNSANRKGAFKYSLEFMGGTSSTVTFDKDYSIEEIDSKIVPVVEKVTGDKNVQFQKVKDSNAVVIKTISLDLEAREAFNKAMADNFGVDTSTITAENISSTVSSEMRTDAVVALVIATICMLLYIWFRFKDIRFGTSAVIALLNDVLFVIAFYAISRTSVGNTFIACILTIVGYSINATIVIFDRIREELKTKKEKSEELSGLVNRCITDTLTRSIYTNATTFIMLAVLYVLGVSSIKEFAMPLMVGVLGGTFSSICITGPLWYVMKTKFVKKKLNGDGGNHDITPVFALRSTYGKNWFVMRKGAPFQEIAEKFQIHPILARLIRNRDVTGNEAIQLYLNGTIADLYDGMLMKDMDKAVDILLEKNYARTKKIRIIGDYDIDGINSTYILLEGIKYLGGEADIDIPDRMRDGYGLNRNLIDRAFDDDIDTIITCDNGIAAREEVAYGKSLGMTIIVTDHHEIPYEEVESEKAIYSAAR